MNRTDLIQYFKLLFKNHSGEIPALTISFFSENKEQFIQISKYTFSNLDDNTLNECYEIAGKEYRSVHPIDIEACVSLTREGLESWLTEERKNTIHNNYLDRYIIYLRQEGRSERVINEIIRSSEDILSKMGDPLSANGFYRKGLVVGSVQSGKTGNFNAVINRAIDSGYDLVIILSGIMEDLRAQTQLRMELEVIGEGIYNFQTGQRGSKGVGNVKRFGPQGDSDIVQITAVTSPRSDFTTLLGQGVSLNNKNIFVCKKNDTILKNLLFWLSDHQPGDTNQIGMPLLIIDDEADNASLNNLGHRGREYASRINGHIRAILELFSKKTYIGYTATPFANVLQDQNEEAEGQWIINYKGRVRRFNQVNNLFPDDFIELLNTPTNYIGAKQIFETVFDEGLKKIPVVESVADCYEAFPLKVIDDAQGTRPAASWEIEVGINGLRSPGSNDNFPVILPDSLIEAIECFILSIAVRLKRYSQMNGSRLNNPHHTMLIHVSRLTAWQNRTHCLVSDKVRSIVNRINIDRVDGADSIFSQLEKTWNKFYAYIIEHSGIHSYLPDGYTDEFLTPVTYIQIRSLLVEACKGLEVKAINSDTQDRLDYSRDSSGNGKKYIVIGGNRLSRGFTLEGLAVNYFVRNTNYADTLLQMGRWFGYRPGYIDCCKLFTTAEAIDKYDAVTRTIEELELEFKKMHRQGKTPRDFILRVRTHPGVLQITRPSILKNTKQVNWSYQDSLVQTTQFDMDSDRISNAWNEIKSLFHTYAAEFQYDDRFHILETDANGLFSFLDSPNSFHEFNSEIQQIKEFVRLCNHKEKLKRWKIAVKSSGSGSELLPAETGLHEKIRMVVRSGPKDETHYRQKLIKKGIFTGSGGSSNIVSGSDMSLWLSEEEKIKAELDYRKQKKQEFSANGMTENEAIEKAARLFVPSHVYRERMDENCGLLVIYLIDTRRVLPDTDKDLRDFKIQKGIDDSIPLIGYAIGFPPIEGNIGGVYVTGDYKIDEEEPESDEFYVDEDPDGNIIDGQNPQDNNSNSFGNEDKMNGENPDAETPEDD